MTIQRILPASRYSEAVIVNGLIFCAGMVPSATSSNATLQTEDVLAQIDALLAQCGSDNLAWDNWVAPGQAPARATVEAKLADPGWKIEIKIIAAQ
jgi:enamine deaminase RidA (YjgF/YER057c/UK114 family)